MMGLGAYRKVQAETETPRQVEARLLARITWQMAAHQNAFDQSQSKIERIGILGQGLRKALSDNMRFWSTMQRDLSSDGNQLEPELKASLISLAIYSVTRSQRLFEADGTVAPLVELNRSIIRGLSGSSEPVIGETA